MPKRALVVLALAISCRATPKVQTTDLVPPGDPGLRPFQFALKDVRLPSGLRLLMEPDTSVPLVGVVEVVAGGAASDPTGREGLSHLLLQLSARSQRRDRERAGVYTVEQSAAFDETIAVSVAPRESLGDLVRLTLARLADPLRGIDDGDLERERSLAEVRLREQVETGAQPALLAMMQRRLFPDGHPYRSALAGTPASVARIGLADLREAAKRQYRPDHMTLLVFGDFDPAALGRALSQHLPDALASGTGAAPEVPATPQRKPPAPPPVRLERAQAALTSPELWIGWSLPAAPTPAVHELVADWMETEVAHPSSPGEKSPDDSAGRQAEVEKKYLKRQLDALAVNASTSPQIFSMLATAMTTPLANPRVAPLSAEDTDIIDMSSFTVSGRQGGMLVCRVRLRDGAHPEASLEHVLNQLYRMWYPPAYYAGRMAYDPRIADLLHEQRALQTRFRVAVRLALGATDTLDRARWTAQRVAEGGEPRIVEHSIEQVAATTETWMEHFAYDWLTRDRARALYLEPSGGAAPRGAPSIVGLAIPAAPAPVEPEHSDAPVPSAPGDPLSAWRTLRLRNGLEVVLVRRPEYPVVTVRLGLLHADFEVPGAIELATQVAMPESKWHGYAADHGIAHTEEVRPDLVAYELSAGSDALPRLLAQLGDRVRSMNITSDAADEFRRRWLPLLVRDDARAEARADRAFWRALYPQRSFGRRPSWAEVGRVDLSAARKWLLEAYTPDRAVLAVVGDIDLDETQKLVEKWLGDWKPVAKPRQGEVKVYFRDRTKLTEPPPPPPPPPRPATLVVHRPGAEVVELHLACRVPDADTSAQAHVYELVAEVLADRLRRELGDAGLAADLDGHAETLQRGPSHLEATGVLAARDVDTAVAKLQSVWTGVDDETLARARARLASRASLRFSTPQKIAREVLDARKHGWPLEVFSSYFHDLLGVSAADVQVTLARCHEVRVLSLVGDETRIRAALAKQ